MLSTGHFPADTLSQLHARQQQRIKGLELIKALMNVVRVIQLHRAASNGALAGNVFFDSKTRVLAREINDRFLSLSQQLNSSNPEIDEQQWADINNAWQTVYLQWRQDDAIENFELHSHLIKQLLELISVLGMQSERMIETDDAHQLLASLIFDQLPKFIEQLGQVRALGTFSAIAGETSQRCSIRLNYLVQVLRRQKNKLNILVESLPSNVLEQISALFKAQLMEQNIGRLQTVVEKDLLSQQKIVTSADELYSLSTQIIDAHFEVMNEGLKILRLRMDARIQAWVHQ